MPFDNPMWFKDIPFYRLINQQIAATKFSMPVEIVSWMGAMQAQDFRMAKWAIGVRLPGSSEKSIEDAINNGEIIRTHLLRPTWHFVTKEDARWIIELTAPHIRSSLNSRHKFLGFSKSIINKCFKIIEESLANGKHLTREAIMTELKKAKIDVSENRSSHIMLMAELDQLVCSGTAKGKKQTYALFNERVPKSKSLKREEALAKLAERYFASHGPATLQDFVWWSGLPVADARNAIEMIKSKFISEKINKKEYWFADSIKIPKKVKESVYLLPAYDEFTISYRDRSAVHNHNMIDKAISNNGIFRPIIVVNGQVVGLWKTVKTKDKLNITIEYFVKQDKVVKGLIEMKIREYRDFYWIK
jgi:DNA glycosylase AlkZ-like